MDNSILILFIALFAVMLLQKVLFNPFNQHGFNKRKAKQILKKLQKFDHPQKIFSYLRKIDPFVFEEIFSLHLKIRAVEQLEINGIQVMVELMEGFLTIVES